MENSDTVADFISRTRQAVAHKGHHKCTSDKPVQQNSVISYEAEAKVVVIDTDIEKRVRDLEVRVNTVISMIGTTNIHFNNINHSNTKSESSSSSDSEANGNTISIGFEQELSNTLDELLAAKNEEALQLFESLRDEIKSKSPKVGTIKGLWFLICEAVPTAKDALDIGKVIAALISM